jgi:hypothetical protein
MSALQPVETSRLFEQYFADGDLDGLMTLYEEDVQNVDPDVAQTSNVHASPGAVFRLGATHPAVP